MIVAQSRGIEFHHSTAEAGWMPPGPEATRSSWDDMQALVNSAGVGYGYLLTKEGKAFRQRIVDYHPPEDTDA